MIYLFPRFCFDNRDFDITLAHELLHATHEDAEEGYIERRAIYTVDTHIEVINYAKEIFEVKNWNDYVKRRKR